MPHNDDSSGEPPTLYVDRTSAKFELGSLFATPGALAELSRMSIAPVVVLQRHCRGDWGDLSSEDVEENDRAVLTGARILSAYEIGGHEKIWIITEADRSATTILLPSEY